MCKVLLINPQPELVVIPLQAAAFCCRCKQVSNSIYSICRLCGSHSVLMLASMIGDPPDPDTTPPACAAGGSVSCRRSGTTLVQLKR